MHVGSEPRLPGVTCQYPTSRLNFRDSPRRSNLKANLDLTVVGKAISRRTGNQHLRERKTENLLPAHFTKHVQEAIKCYQSESIVSSSNSGQSTPTELNNSWSGIQSCTTGLSTERSSVYSWRDDEFDKANTQKVHQLFWDVDEILFEGKINSRTQNLEEECKAWTKRSPHLRILGRQLLPSKDEGFQHFQTKKNSSAVTRSAANVCESNTELKELCLSGQRLIPTASPSHSISATESNGGSVFSEPSESSTYSFLEEEIYVMDGKIEEYFAFDSKELDDDGLEPKKTLSVWKQNKRGIPPVSPTSCIKEAVMAEIFDEIWRCVVEMLDEPIRKHWESGLADDDKHMVSLKIFDSKLASVPISRITVETLSVPPSRGSEARSTLFGTHFIQSQVPRTANTFNSDLNGVMTIHAIPLQQRYAGLIEKTQPDQDEKSTGLNVLTSVRNRLGRISDHSTLSSSRVMQGMTRKQSIQRKLPSLNADPLRLKTGNVYSDEVLRGKKMYTSTDHMSSLSAQTIQNNKLPPIISDVVEHHLTVPGSRHAFHKIRHPHSRVSSAVPDTTGQWPLRERTATLDHFSRPNTTHTFRSDTLFKRSFTPMDFTNNTRSGQNSASDRNRIGVTGVSLGISHSSNQSDSAYHPRHSVYEQSREGEEEFHSVWGPHFQQKNNNRNLPSSRKRFQMVS
ncbi:protein FAM149A [Protopterus annectens]|uniref:protein FAM149A n=1 Tax=Protopterus annectens TaxID=7888 RepID=UPI001CF9675D|nr:protein FAM149A [Protopterus annectens]